MEKDKNSKVILVNDKDQIVGEEEKLSAHKKGLLHRAFSVFIFFQKTTSSPTEVLLQQRQFNKYHSPGLWTNTCCSHPQPGETVIEAGERRLVEEMGISLPLKEVGGFHYIAKFNNGLTENELDHILIGFAHSKEVPFNKDEVNAIRWIEIETLLKELVESNEQYTPWFEKALEIALQ